MYVYAFKGSLSLDRCALCSDLPSNTSIMEIKRTYKYQWGKEEDCECETAQDIGHTVHAQVDAASAHQGAPHSTYMYQVSQN